MLCHCAIGAPLTKDDLVGTYHVDVSDAEDAQTVPTNFYKVALILNADGSFVTTNAPLKFFFDYDPPPPGEKEVTHGTWEVEHVSGGGLITADMLELTFSTTSWTGSWSHPVKVHRGVPRIKVPYHPFEGSDAIFHFYLTKQKR